MKRLELDTVRLLKQRLSLSQGVLKRRGVRGWLVKSWRSGKAVVKGEVGEKVIVISFYPILSTIYYKQ